MKLSRIAPLVAVAALAVTLSGCDDSGDVAAHVGDRAIPTSQVDLLSRISCAAADASAGQAGAAVSTVRAQSMAWLVDLNVMELFDAKEHADYDRSALLTAMQQVESSLGTVASSDRDDVRALIRRYAIAQFKLESVGKEKLVAGGVAKPTEQQELSAGQQELTAFQKTVHISVDPRYAPDSKGNAGAGERSLSRAVSSFAKQADAAQPSATWVSALPPQQRCGA